MLEEPALTEERQKTDLIEEAENQNEKLLTEESPKKATDHPRNEQKVKEENGIQKLAQPRGDKNNSKPVNFRIRSNNLGAVNRQADEGKESNVITSL